jgi:hypothetical protein
MECHSVVPEVDLGDCWTGAVSAFIVQQTMAHCLLLSSSKLALHVVHDDESLRSRICIVGGDGRDIVGRLKQSIARPSGRKVPLLSYPAERS